MTSRSRGRFPRDSKRYDVSLLDAQDAEGGSEAAVDSVFSIPVEAAKLVTGFAHDETEPDSGFAVLART
jgi:hypothetical protein